MIKDIGKPIGRAGWTRGPCTVCGEREAHMQSGECFDCWAIKQPWARKRRPWARWIVTTIWIAFVIFIASIILPIIAK